MKLFPHRSTPARKTARKPMPSSFACMEIHPSWLMRSRKRAYIPQPKPGPVIQGGSATRNGGAQT